MATTATDTALSFDPRTRTSTPPTRPRTRTHARRHQATHGQPQVSQGFRTLGAPSRPRRPGLPKQRARGARPCGRANPCSRRSPAPPCSASTARSSTVEVHVSKGLPGYHVVGLPDAAVRESRERVRAAILSSDATWPQRRVTVNLAPGAVRKTGAGLDLAVALGVLAATDQLPSGVLDEVAVLGELGLDGSIRPVPGHARARRRRRAAPGRARSSCQRRTRPRRRSSRR